MLHIYNVILVYKNLCELQEFVISNKIFYVDSFPFFSREFLSFSFSTTGFQTQEIPWDCFYNGPVLEYCLLFKWELLMSVVSCNVTGLKEWGETHPSHAVSKPVQMTAEQTSP